MAEDTAAVADISAVAVVSPVARMAAADAALLRPQAEGFTAAAVTAVVMAAVADSTAAERM